LHKIECSHLKKKLNNMSIRKATNKSFNQGNKSYLFTPRLDTGQEQPSSAIPTLPSDQQFANTDNILKPNSTSDSDMDVIIKRKGSRVKPVFNNYDGTTRNNHTQIVTTNRVGFLIQNELFVPYFNKTRLAFTQYPLISKDNFYGMHHLADGRLAPLITFSIPGPNSYRHFFSQLSYELAVTPPILNDDFEIIDETEQLSFRMSELSNLTAGSGETQIEFRDPFNMSFQAQSIEYVTDYSGISNPDSLLFNRVENYGDIRDYYISVYTSGSEGASIAVPPSCPECRRKQFTAIDAGLCGPSGTESCPDVGHNIEDGPFYDTFRQAAEAIGFSFIGNEGDNEEDGSNYDSTDVGLYVAGAEIGEVIQFRKVPFQPNGKKLNFVKCAEAAAQITQFEISWGTDASLVEEINATGQALVLASGRAKYPNPTSHVLCPTYWKFVS
tara:strand:+ start:288 stop:1610 length:1323 start_codon:yes stop_codon:yes gene_type:complete